jgi:hypothetical protein
MLKLILSHGPRVLLVGAFHVVLDPAIFGYREEANHLERSLDAAVPGLFKSNEFPNLEDVRHVFIPPVFSRVRVVRGFNNKTDDESHGSATASRFVDVWREILNARPAVPSRRRSGLIARPNQSSRLGSEHGLTKARALKRSAYVSVEEVTFPKKRRDAVHDRLRKFGVGAVVHAGPQPSQQCRRGGQS